MTAQLTAPANLKALYTDPDYEPTLDEWNWLVHAAGAAYKSELSRGRCSSRNCSG